MLFARPIDERAVEAQARNLAATMSCFAHGIDAARVVHAPGLVIVEVGAHFPMFNCALFDRPVENECEALRRLEVASEHFDAGELGWSFWVCEGWLPQSARRTFFSRLRAYGLERASVSPALLATSLRPPTRALPQLVIRPVGDETSRQSFCHIMRSAFEGPHRQLSAIYGAAAFWTGRFRGFIGSLDGLDVCAGATVTANDAIGIYALGTLAPFMRRGCAEAIIRNMSRQAWEEAPDVPLVLQSTPMSDRLYRRMGFQSSTTFALYSTPFDRPWRKPGSRPPADLRGPSR